MSEFLVITPDSNRSEDTESLNPYILEILAETSEAFSKFARNDESVRSEIVSISPKFGTHSLLRSRKEKSITLSGDYWALASDNRTSESIHANIRLIAGNIEYSKPVWGTYAAVFGERYVNRIFAWNTTPALESIHYASLNGMHFVSNRPLLIALAISKLRGAGISLSYSYLEEYLSYGYSLEGYTPFESVKTLPVNHSIRIKDGRFSFDRLPAGLTPDFSVDHDLQEGGHALAEALLNSTSERIAQFETPRVQLRLSGGKDSRMLLGAMRQSEVGIRAVTYGVQGEPETILASGLAALSGIEHVITKPVLELGDSISDRVRNVIRDCMGIPPSEAHLAQYRGAVPDFFNEPIALGQWPLWKGGMAKLLRNKPEYTRSVLRKQASGLLKDSLAASQELFLQAWSSEVTASTELEKLYLFAREFRSGSYMQSHINHYSQDADIFYPISDMRVTVVLDRLSMAEKVSEKSLFLALREIWPESLELSLHGSDWRFERGGADPDLSGESYQKRTAPLSSGIRTLPENSPKGAEGSALSKATLVGLCSELLGSDSWSHLRTLLDESFIVSVEDYSSGKGQTYCETTREFGKYVWRTFTACIWLEGNWASL